MVDNAALIISVCVDECYVFNFMLNPHQSVWLLVNIRLNSYQSVGRMLYIEHEALLISVSVDECYD